MADPPALPKPQSILKYSIERCTRYLRILLESSMGGAVSLVLTLAVDQTGAVVSANGHSIIHAGR